MLRNEEFSIPTEWIHSFSNNSAIQNKYIILMKIEENFAIQKKIIIYEDLRIKVNLLFK